jgi:2-polyprenyl-3-methyl-5-hydroxy-6-metoxy-1,4-benzoquinol methylase
MVTRFWNFERRRPENFFSFQVGAVIVQKFRGKFTVESQVVDYGAGAGFLLDDLLAAGVRSAAVEFGEDAVLQLNKRLEKNPLFLGAYSVDALNGWKGNFDAALLIEVIEHLYDPELTVALSSVRDLLKPGGILIVTTPNEEDRSKSFICSPESGKLFHRFQHVRSWSASSLSAHLQSSGFSVVETGTTDFGASVLALRRTMPLWWRILCSLVRHLRPKRPHLYVVARRV